METVMEIRSRSPSPRVSPTHEEHMPQVMSLNWNDNHSILSSKMTIEEQLRIKFLGESIPSGDSVSESVKSKISSYKKQSKVNVNKKQVKKTVMMTETKVEISDSDEYSEEDEDERMQRSVYSRKTASKRNSSWSRRPSVNPALLNLSSSDLETSSDESTNIDGDYVTEHYPPPTSSSDGDSIDHEHSMEFSRIMRKTQIEKRKTFRELQRNSQRGIALEESNLGLQRFQAAASRVKIARRLSIALARQNIQDRQDRIIVMSKASKASAHNHTVELPPQIQHRRAVHRRAAIKGMAGTESVVDIREQMERLVANNEEDSDKLIINPFSKLRFRWDIITVFIILCNVITLPLEFSFFDGRSDLDGIKMFTDIWFMVDIMLNFRTGILTIPFDVIVSGLLGDPDGVNIEDVATYLQIARMLKILKLLRLLRLGRFVRYLHRWEEILSMDYGTGENVMKGVQWLLVMLFICHWNACILYLIPSFSETGRPMNGTMGQMDGPQETYTYSWVYSANMGSMAPYQQYFWCLFKSMSHMLTIGYGVNTPIIMSDLWTSIFVMFVGALTFALFLSQIISLVDQMKITATSFKRHIREVDDYLRFNRCPTNLKHAVKEYYDYHYRQRIFDEETIFAELNPLLLEEVTTCGIIEFIQDCELFRSCRLDLQHELCKLFKVEMYQPYTNILVMGRPARTFSIIRQGVVSVESDRAKRGHFYHLEEGDSFGLEAFSNIANPRYVTTALAETWVEVLQINIADLHEFGRVKSEFRDSLNLIDTIANQQLKASGIHAQITNRQREVRKYFG